MSPHGPTPPAEAQDDEGTLEVQMTSPRGPASRRRVRLLVGALTAVLVLTGVGVATSLWLADRADKADLAAATAAATEDVQTLSRAGTLAEDAFAEHQTTVDLALAHLSSTAVPVQDHLTAVADDIGQEHVDQVATVVERLTVTLEPPLTADGDVITRDEPGEAVPVLAVRLPHVVETDDLVAALTAHYRTFPAQDRAPARAEVTREAARFDALTETLHEATAAVRAAVDEVEVAVAAAADGVRAAGAETLATLEHADEESRAAFQAVLDDLAVIGATELPVPWETRSPEQASAFVGADTALEAYASTAEAARASHVTNTPPPPRARSGGGGSSGGGSGRQPRACMKYSAWGGTYIGWCY